MESKLFKITLKSDIILNSSLATEGNLESLDFIPGSNILGIVAQHYNQFEDLQYEVFHSEKVKFGNAYKTDGDLISFPMPFDVLRPKGSVDFFNVKLHHATNHTKNKTLQLKQERRGYINLNGKLITSVKKHFALKSAFDNEKRRSKEGQMFGYESIEKGQSFIFSVYAATSDLLLIITDKLKGHHQIGKSKTAQYGAIDINEINHNNEPLSFDNEKDYTLVYALSHLSFTDEYGSPTFQPSTKDLGLDSGIIDWSKSSIRTFQYTPWNGHRNTSGIQRHCIAKGSVFYVDGVKSKEKHWVGAYNFDGLGQVIYNPVFLKPEGEDAAMIKSANLTIPKIDDQDGENKLKLPKTPLGILLHNIKMANELELKISKEIDDAVKNENGCLLEVSKSQWGKVRMIAATAQDDRDMQEKLKAELSIGVAARKYWLKDDEKAKIKFERIIVGKNRTFVVKFAAEIAKKIERNKNKNNLVHGK